MNTKLKACFIGGALLAGLSATASARDHVNFSLSFGIPGPVYVAPPPPVYYAPPEPVAYYGPPSAAVYYGPPARGFYDRFGRWHPYRHHYRHW